MENKCGNCESINNNTSKYCSICGYKLPEIEKPLEINHKTSLVDKNHVNKKTNLMKYILGFIIGFSIFFYFTQSTFFKPSMDKVMAESASEINKTCPFMVDKDTQLDNAVALPENIFQYNYTLLNLEKASMNIQEFRNYMIPNSISYVKKTPEMKYFRDNNVTVNYYYKDKNGEYLTTISVKPEDYN